MKLGLRMFVGFWLLGFSFEAVNALGQDFHHPGMFHGHLWDGPIKIGWITSCFLASIPLMSMLVNLLSTGELDGTLFDDYASPGMILLYGVGLATVILAPFQGVLNSFGPIAKVTINLIVGSIIMSIWCGFTRTRKATVLWEAGPQSVPLVMSKAKISVVQEQLSLPL